MRPYPPLRETDFFRRESPRPGRVQSPLANEIVRGAKQDLLRETCSKPRRRHTLESEARGGKLRPLDLTVEGAREIREKKRHYGAYAPPPLQPPSRQESRASCSAGSSRSCATPGGMGGLITPVGHQPMLISPPRSDPTAQRRTGGGTLPTTDEPPLRPRADTDRPRRKKSKEKKRESKERHVAGRTDTRTSEKPEVLRTPETRTPDLKSPRDWDVPCEGSPGPLTASPPWPPALEDERAPPWAHPSPSGGDEPWALEEPPWAPVPSRQERDRARTEPPWRPHEPSWAASTEPPWAQHGAEPWEQPVSSEPPWAQHVSSSEEPPWAQHVASDPPWEQHEPSPGLASPEPGVRLAEPLDDFGFAGIPHVAVGPPPPGWISLGPIPVEQSPRLVGRLDGRLEVRQGSHGVCEVSVSVPNVKALLSASFLGRSISVDERSPGAMPKHDRQLSGFTYFSDVPIRQLSGDPFEDSLSSSPSLVLVASTEDLDFAQVQAGSPREPACPAEKLNSSQREKLSTSQKFWVRGEEIGSGSLGTVFTALNQEDGRILAVKEVKECHGALSENELDSLQTEIELYQNLKHEHIVSYLGHGRVEKSLYIYLEYMPGGSLAQVLTQYGRLDEVLIRVYARQILLGLNYLHTQDPPIVHRDIKGANILVGLDCKVKLSDFGCSVRAKLRTGCAEESASLDACATMKGSIPWMAPEVMNNQSYGRKADIWSFGCLLLEMATAERPWGSFDNELAALCRIALSQDVPTVPDHLSAPLRDFITGCLKRDPKERPYTDELLLHEFLQE